MFMTDINTIAMDDVLPDKTTIRYEGSITELRGHYGWVEASYMHRNEVRYDIVLSVGAYQPVQRLHLARRASLVPGENLG